MSQEELLANLEPIRLPLSFAEFTLRDGLLALCFGLLAGLLLARLVAAFSSRRVTTGDQVRAEIDRLAGLDTEAQLVGLAGLLKTYDTEAATRLGLSKALYDPAISADPRQIERAIMSAVRAAK